MEFNINNEIKDKINELEEFIERVIKPLENKNRQEKLPRFNKKF